MKWTILKKFKMADSRWRIQDSCNYDVKDVIVTSLLLLITTNLLSCTRILSDMLLLRLRGYTSNLEEMKLSKWRSYMTSYYVSIPTKPLKLLELLSSSSTVNLVNIALTVLKLHRGIQKPPPPLPRPQKVKKKSPLWIRLKDGKSEQTSPKFVSKWPILKQ